MKGWMKYRHKRGIASHIPGLHVDHRLYFVLTDEGVLHGCEDETAAEKLKQCTSFDIRDAAITSNRESTNQFEIIDDKFHIVFTVENAAEALNWMSSLQLQRSLKQVTPIGDQTVQSSQVDERAMRMQPNRMSNVKKPESLNGELVYDDPLSVPNSAFDNTDFEWDVAPDSTFAPSLPAEESSAVFRLSEELSSVKDELDRCRQKIQSYQEVLALRDQQLFEMRDEASNREQAQADSSANVDLEMQVRSYREQNALLNEEVLKLHQMYSKTSTESKNQKKRADGLAVELRRCQRDYLSALGSCVYRPLVDPDDGAYFMIPDREYHLSTLKSLARSMKSKNDRILGCPIPTLGKSEHVDAFSFVHSLPTEALQVQYLCQHLTDAYNILMETDEENQKNLKKWKACIMDGNDEFELTPQLRKLVLHGVPSQYRAYLWQKLIFYYVADLRRSLDENHYKVLLRQQELMSGDKNFVKYLKQISMDVPRTMPTNRDYSSTESAHRERLHNVLTAFCVYSPSIGYCQGFNFLAGGCLLFLEEEDAFWFLAAVTEKIFPPNYYKNGLAGLLADQYVLQEVVAEYLPKLNEHLAKFPEVDLAAVTTGWFLGLFFDCLPFQTLIRVWDCFLAFGHAAVFRVSFAMLKMYEARLLELYELSQLLHAAKNIPKLCTHPTQLIKEAFSSSFPPWEDIEEARFRVEQELIEKHERKMQQRRFYDQRLMLLEENEGLLDIPSDKWIFNCGDAADKFIFGACSSIAQNSQVYEIDSDFVRPLRLPITDRVMCVYVISDDVILVGLFSGQLQAYSISMSGLLWSTSLSDVVLCVLTYDDVICAGTADGKIHFLSVADAPPDKVFVSKPKLLDSIELSKRATTCCCHIVEQNCLWIASGPAIYVVSVVTMETDGFFLVSSRIDQVSAMQHWSDYVLLSVRGSSVLQLHGTEVYSNPPLLVFDVSKQANLPLLYPMIPDDGGVKSPTTSRITCLLTISDDVFWVATSGGDIFMYSLHLKDGLSAPVSHPTTDQSDIGSFTLQTLRTQHACKRPIRCLVKSHTRVASCAGFYGEENSVRAWSLDGEIALPEVSVSESSSSDVLDDAKSLASSSRSLDADMRMQKSDGTVETVKSAMKSATATMMKTYRDKKPHIRKFMNMFGGAGSVPSEDGDGPSSNFS